MNCESIYQEAKEKYSDMLNAGCSMESILSLMIRSERMLSKSNEFWMNFYKESYQNLKETFYND